MPRQGYPLAVAQDFGLLWVSKVSNGIAAFVLLVELRFGHPNVLPAREIDCYSAGKVYNVGKVDALAITPDGKTLISGGHDGVVRFWDLARILPAGDIEP